MHDKILPYSESGESQWQKGHPAVENLLNKFCLTCESRKKWVLNDDGDDDVGCQGIG